MAAADEQSAVGLLLRTYRQQRDLTIENLSETSGISVRTISDIERGVSAGPQQRTVAALADALRLSAEERSEFTAAARAGRPGSIPSDPILNSRPNRVVDFTGRSTERALLATLLLDASIPTAPPAALIVSGPPGVGKTALALETLSEVPYDTILFVDLQGFEVAALTPLQILQALLRQATGGHTEVLTMGDAALAWRGLQIQSPIAVLLDNAASEAQVRPVLATDAAVQVIVTSRRTLAGLEGARRIVLGALRREDGIALLRRSINDEQAAVGDLDEIARFCADLPLALRIAAARLASRPQWTVEDYANRLRLEDGRIRQLVAGDLNVESTFALSYRALSERSREFFRSLALLRGSSFSARMASAVHGYDPVQSTDFLDELVDLGLVESLMGDRYRLHDLLRIFAGDQMRREEADNSIAAQRNRLLEWILETTMAMARSYSRDATSTGIESYRPDLAAREWLLAESAYWIDAIHQAASLGRYREVSDLVVALLEFSDREVAGLDWWALLELGATSSAHLGESATLARLHYARADWQLGIRGDVGLARASAQEAVRIAEGVGDDRELARALIGLSAAMSREGDHDEAHALGIRGREILQTLGDVELEARARKILLTELPDSDPSAALRECRSLLALLDGVELSAITRVLALNAVTRSLVAIESWEEALAASELFVDEAARFADEPDFLARAYRHRGFAEAALGMHDRARADLETAVGMARSYAPSWWSAEIDELLEGLDSRR
ncbi:helix-turn-helix domain-containing protein [Herbiconiux sp. UC225_62]|uniref:helix-turn-helix domain-containing protein n=1 Tax=Herbiconiux sp. UC225_62 TaxID=3350168 RepID=UPI0036D30915